MSIVKSVVVGDSIKNIRFVDMGKPSMKDTVASAVPAFTKPIAPGSRAIYSRDGTRVITIPGSSSSSSSKSGAGGVTTTTDKCNHDMYEQQQELNGSSYTAGEDISFEYKNASKKTRRGVRGKKSGGEGSKGEVKLHVDGKSITINDVDVGSAQAIMNATSTAVETAARASTSNSKKQKTEQDRIWDTSSEEERLRIKEFWKELSEGERRSLVRIDKDAILQKMREQQRLACSCPVCGRKRMAIEQELEALCDSYQPHFPGEEDHGVLVSSTSVEPVSIGPVEGNETSKKSKVNFGSSLLFQGGILTVADDLLKNDGKKFIDVMEKLSGRSFEPGRTEELYDEYEEYDSDSEDEEPPQQQPQQEEEDPCEYSEEDQYESEEDEYDDESDSDQSLFSKPKGKHRSSKPRIDEMTSEERSAEGRKMLQTFAARIFEQRVLNAYREKVAQERQRRLLEELEEESRLEEEREQRRLAEKEKKKDKKRQMKLAKEEEQARVAAEQAKAEKEKKEKEREKREAKLRKAEEERKKKEEAEQKQREKRLLKEEQKRQQEAEQRRKREEEQRKKEQEEQRKREQEEQRRKEEEQYKLEQQELRRQEQQRQAAELRQQQQSDSQRELQLKLLRALQSPRSASPVSPASPASHTLSPSTSTTAQLAPVNAHASYIMNALLSPPPQQPSVPPQQSHPGPQVQQRSVTGGGGYSLGSIGSAHTPTKATSPVTRHQSLSYDAPAVDELGRLLGSRSLLDDGTPPIQSPGGLYSSPSTIHNLPLPSLTSLQRQAPPVQKSIFSPSWPSRSMWSSTSGTTSPGTAISNNGSSTPLTHVRQASIAAYNQFTSHEWTVDGFVPAQVLYHETLKRLGAMVTLSQADFFEAIGIDNSTISDRFEAKRDNLGLVTHVRYTNGGTCLPVGYQPTAATAPGTASPWAIRSGV